MKILLFGPDKSSVLKLASPLEAAGFDCDILFTQKKMVEFLSRISTYDFPGVVILGEGISGKVRSSFLEQVTEMVFSFPVLHVVSPDAFETIFEGMATKMMDYICLPVRSKELVTRTGILIRQAYPERVEEQTLRYGPYVFRVILTGQVSGDAISLCPQKSTVLDGFFSIISENPFRE